jgi:hypothetical protein
MTKRRSKALRLKKKQKEVLDFDRQLTEIYKRQNNPRRVKLDKPHNVGWQKIWHIRKDRGLLEEEIDAIQNYLDTCTYLHWARKKSRLTAEVPRVKIYLTKKDLKALPTKKVKLLFDTDWMAFLANKRYRISDYAYRQYFWTEIIHYRVNEAAEFDPRLESRKYFLHKRLYGEGQWRKFAGRDNGGGKDHHCLGESRCAEHYHRKADKKIARVEINEAVQDIIAPIE